MTKTLATFRVESEDWNTFKNLAISEGSNATEVFKEFMQWYIAGNRISPGADTPDSTSNRLDKPTDNQLDNRIDDIESRLDNRIDDIESRLDKVRLQLEEQFLLQLEELRGKLKAR